MTLQMMCEIIRQQFPEKMDTQIRIDLNNAYRLFSEETRLPFGDFTVSEVDDAMLPIGVGVLSETEGWHSLPLSVRDIVTVSALDSKDNVITTPDYYVEHVGRTFAILDLNNHLYKGTGLPPPIRSLKFGCSVRPTDLHSDLDSPEYPEAFHQGLVDHVLAKYYAYKGILQQSGWFRQSYKESVQAGKKFFNRSIQ